MAVIGTQTLTQGGTITASDDEVVSLLSGSGRSEIVVVSVTRTTAEGIGYVSSLGGEVTYLPRIPSETAEAVVGSQALTQGGVITASVLSGSGVSYVVVVSETKMMTEGISYVSYLGGEVTKVPAQFTGAGARVMRMKLWVMIGALTAWRLLYT